MRFYSLQACGVEKAEDPELQIEHEEIKKILNSELAALSAQERDALMVRANLDGTTYRSVARHYGVAPQTAWNWAAAAVEKLRPRLSRLEGLL